MVGIMMLSKSKFVNNFWFGSVHFFLNENRVFLCKRNFWQKLVSGMYVDTKLWTCTHVKNIGSTSHRNPRKNPWAGPATWRGNPIMGMFGPCFQQKSNGLDPICLLINLYSFQWQLKYFLLKKPRTFGIHVHLIWRCAYFSDGLNWNHVTSKQLDEERWGHWPKRVVLGWFFQSLRVGQGRGYSESWRQPERRMFSQLFSGKLT